MIILDLLPLPFLIFLQWVLRFFPDHLQIVQPSLIPIIKSSRASIVENIKSEKARAIVPVEKYKITNALNMVTGKTKEKRFNCGAERVMMPAETLIMSIIPTTGSIIKEAAINIDPAAFMPAPMRTKGGGIAPIGSIE